MCSLLHTPKYHTHTHAKTNAHMHARKHVYTHTRTCTHACLPTHARTHTHTHTHIHTHTHLSSLMQVGYLGQTECNEDISSLEGEEDACKRHSPTHQHSQCVATLTMKKVPTAHPPRLLTPSNRLKTSGCCG